MRSILEKAIVHLLNEEQDKAEALFHKFMVEKARRIHESLRSGEAVLAEGWDDEITSEEYVSDNDLDSVEDQDGEMAPGEAGDALGGDLGLDADADAEMADADAEGADADAEIADADADAIGDDDAALDGEAGEEPEAVEDRLADVEDQIEKLTADFDRMMGELDGEDGLGDDDGLGDGMGGDDDALGDGLGGDEDGLGDAMGGGDDSMGDAMGGEDAMGGDDAMADRMEDDVTDDDEFAPHDEMAEADDMGEDADDGSDDVMEGKKGKVPPQFLKNIKKKKGVKEETPVEEDDDNLDDITESVMAELERISVSMEDGKEVAAGKKITTNDKSPLIQASVDKRGGAKPVTIKGPTHSGYERETAPSSKDYEKKKNTVRGKADSVLSRVPDKGDKSALLNKDFAGSKQD